MKQLVVSINCSDEENKERKKKNTADKNKTSEKFQNPISSKDMKELFGAYVAGPTNRSITLIKSDQVDNVTPLSMADSLRVNFPRQLSQQSVSSFVVDPMADHVRERRRQTYNLISRLPRKIISSYTIRYMTRDEANKAPLLLVTLPSLLYESGTNGVNDKRLGCVEKQKHCITCHRKYGDCEGHRGKIDLHTPFVNPCCVLEVSYILNSTCGYCGKPYPTMDYIQDSQICKLTGIKYLRALSDASAELSKYHTHPNFTRKVYDTKAMKGYRLTFKKGNTEYFEPTKNIISIFETFDQEALRIFRMTGKNHPVNMILSSLIVIPPHLRQPAMVNGKMQEHPLNIKYHDIIMINRQLEHNSSGNIMVQVRDRLLENQYQKIKEIINGPDSKTIVKGNGQDVGILKSFNGKTGSIRDGVMARRVNQCGRTVAGPSVKGYGKIGIPRVFAETLTVREKVNKFNQDIINQGIRDGTYKFIIFLENGERKKFIISEKFRGRIVATIGNEVERPIRDGDMVMAGRQPTLHAESIQGFEVYLHDKMVIELHSSNDGPFNCDYDGDELTIHILQTIPARVAAKNHANTKSHILNCQSNRPMIGIAFYGILSGYLMTKSWKRDDGSIKEVEIPERRWVSAIASVPNSFRKMTLKRRCERHGVNPRSGRALASLALPVNFTYKGNKLNIVDGILVEGVLCKKNLGTATNSIVHLIAKQYSEKEAARFIDEFSNIANWFTNWHSFSIGYRSFSTNRKEIHSLLRADLLSLQTRFYNLGEQPTDAIEELFWKRSVHRLLSQVQQLGKKLGNSYLGEQNPLVILGGHGSGAKGSDMNTAQITGMLGAQLIQSDLQEAELNNGERRIPLFKRRDCSLGAQGVVLNSFYDGLTVAELFFHLCSGREGLVDTANNTADIGYTRRRVEKSLEDKNIDERGMVSSVTGNVIQITYDGLKATMLVPTTTTKFGKILMFTNFKDQATQLNRIFEYIKENGIPEGRM